MVDKSTGRPKIIGLEFSKLRHQDAYTTRDAMFSTLQKHGVSKAEKKMVSVSVDGASVNMGRHKGLKTLIQNNPGMSRGDPNLDYWGWWWYLFIHCVNHLLELGVGYLKHADPYVEEFDVQLKKVFSIWYATF